MPKINENIPLGAIHIRLPFESMDDVHFSGAYGGVADALVEKLREHLANKKQETDTSDDSDEEDIKNAR